MDSNTSSKIQNPKILHFAHQKYLQTMELKLRIISVPQNKHCTILHKSEYCKQWAGQMVQVLRAVSAPLEDQSSFLRTAIGSSQLSVNPALQYLISSSGLHWHSQSHVCNYIQTDIHTCAEMNNVIKGSLFVNQMGRGKCCTGDNLMERLLTLQIKIFCCII